MNFEQFVRFCKDFGIFPNVLSKAKLSIIFGTLSAIHTNSITEKNSTDNPKGKVFRSNFLNFLLVKSSYLRKSVKYGINKTINDKAFDQPEDDLIDQHLFIEAVALCAFELQYSNPQPSSIEKVPILNLLYFKLKDLLLT